MQKSNQVNRKFIDTVDVEDYEIWTDSGWQDINSVSVTVPYQIYYVKTISYELKGADDHIIIDQLGNEVYLKEIEVGDLIKTKIGIEPVIDKQIFDEYEHMYDMDINSDDSTYYTNGILSHNSSVLGNIAVRSALTGHNVGIATNELSKAAYLKRIGTNILGIKDENYDKIANEKNDKLQQVINKKKKEFSESKGYDMGKVMVEEFMENNITASTIESMYVDIENSFNIKFNVIIVDYLNLMGSEKRAYNMYERVKFIAEELRKMAMRNNWCVITATQVKREFYEKENLPMGSSAESSGLEATIDGLFGLVRPEFSTVTKIQSIAQRERAKYVGSYKQFNFNNNYNRLVELDTPESEFYPDQKEGVLEKEINEQESKGQNMAIESESVSPEPSNENSEEVVFDQEF